MYQALYRKWRPRTFDDVVGQEHITQSLKRQIAAGRPSHAYLFTGTRGTGKTTCAKILARAVNCEHPVDGNPCNQCPACLGIEDGSVLDVLEIDAASNTSVDNIRDLREEAVYTPAAVRKRVYIIDEVHMLSKSAFNALLKILEEPPEHLMFILATTELHKVLPTIRSRCQQYAFKRITVPVIEQRISYIAEQEHLELTPDAASMLARLADGGLRDALSLMDQCSSGEGAITEETILTVLGLAGSRKASQIMLCAAEENTAGALQILDELYRDGKDMSALLGELSSLVRDILVCKTAPGNRELVSGGCSEEILQDLAGRFTSAELVQCLTILQDSRTSLSRSVSRRVDAELCVIRLCSRALSESYEGLAARISRIEAAIHSGVPVPVQRQVQDVPQRQSQTPVPAEKPKPQNAPQQPESPAAAMPSVDDIPPWEAPVPERPVREQPVVPQQHVAMSTPAEPPKHIVQTPAPVQAEQPQIATPSPKQAINPALSWEGFLRASTKSITPMTAGYLTQASMVSGVFSGDTLTIYTDDDFVRNIISGTTSMKGIVRAASEYAGCPVRVSVKLQTQQQSAGGDMFASLAQKAQGYSNLTVR